MPIHQLPLPDRLQILEAMPTFAARGLEGEASADAAPVVEVDPVAKYLVDSEGDKDKEATCASTSARGPSSSRAAPEEDVL